jgi:hypothetical protein
MTKGWSVVGLVLGLLAVVVLAAGTFARPAPATHLAGDLLPDLVTVAPSNLYISTPKPKTRQLRFANTVANVHTGVLELTWASEDCDGDGKARNDRTAYQRIFADSNADGVFTRGADSGFRRERAGCFDFHPQHHHWHLDDFARYELFRWSAGAGRGALVGTTDKVSFCIIDSYRSNPELAGSPSAKFFSTCSRDGDQGLSVGWADTYGAHLDGQHIAITGLAAGVYCLVSTADPSDVLVESDESNNETGIQVTLSANSVTWQPTSPC